MRLGLERIYPAAAIRKNPIAARAYHGAEEYITTTYMLIAIAVTEASLAIGGMTLC